ncbi:hypothetical protein HII13_004967 [Brettanomyces bruxellensis]|nr:hypothetical protein HII13_004967 [Brettanomyces bruxellensis]
MTVQEQIPIWIDCDPGQDDIVAITLAAYNPHFKLVGLSTVHGNAELTYTTRNALRFLTALNKMDIPVYPGSSSSLHGNIDGAPEIEKYNGKLCIAAIAPLTNLALFFGKYPELKNQIHFLTVMGGGFKRFNRNEVAEFNIFDDSQAAHDIFEDEVLSQHILLAPLDTTSTVRATANIRKQVLGSESVVLASNFRALMYQLDQIMLDRAFMIRRAVDVIVDGKEDGATKMLAENEFPGRTIKILTDLNREKFWQLILDAYAEADKNAYINGLDRQKLIEGYKP